MLRPGSELPAIDNLFPRLEESDKEAITDAVTQQKKEEKESQAEIKEKQLPYDHFRQLDLRVAEIVAVEPIKKSRKLLKLTVHAPEERTIVAGIAEHYTTEELIGRQVLIVANLQPVKIMGVSSEGMVLAARTEENGQERLVLAAVSAPVVPGSKVS
jgi:methionyl-tRNA synthetase